MGDGVRVTKDPIDRSELVIITKFVEIFNFGLGDVGDDSHLLRLCFQSSPIK